jgi:hypothetical protein
VAIKVLPDYWSRDPERLHRFELEAQAAAALNHPDIVSIFYVGQYDLTPYIVTELLQGETLRERLRSGPIPLRKAIEYAIQIAKGLAAAHGRGIVVCWACSAVRRCKSSTQPDGGEGLAKRKGYRREAGSRRSVKQTCESMDKNRV